MATTQLQPTVFLWQGRDKRGTKLKGQQIATTPNLVRAELRRQGINPISVKKKPKPLFGGAGRRITSKDVAVFSRQLATKSGQRSNPAVHCTKRWANTRSSSMNFTPTW